MRKLTLSMAIALCWTPRLAFGDGMPVTYLDGVRVKAAFDEGAVLFDDAGTNYMVRASRRDAAGRCEIHTKDTDIIHVVKVR